MHGQTIRQGKGLIPKHQCHPRRLKCVFIYLREVKGNDDQDLFCPHDPGVSLVVDVNECLDRKQSEHILSVLRSSSSNIHNIIPECANKYYDTLVKMKESKTDNGKHFHDLAQICHLKYSGFYGIVIS